MLVLFKVVIIRYSVVAEFDNTSSVVVHLNRLHDIVFGCAFCGFLLQLSLSENLLFMFLKNSEYLDRSSSRL